MGGLSLEVSNEVKCLGVWLIIAIVTFTFGIGLIIGYKLVKLKLDKTSFTVNEVYKKVS